MQQEGVTDRQIEILRAIEVLTAKCGYPPSVRDLCEYVQMPSTGAMNKHLYTLVRKGLLSQDVATSRSIVITELGRQLVSAR